MPDINEHGLVVNLWTLSLLPAAGKLDSRTVAKVLNSLQSWPSLRMLHLPGTDMAWVEDVVAAFGALCRAKPCLQVLGKTMGTDWLPDAYDGFEHL